MGARGSFFGATPLPSRTGADKDDVLFPFVEGFIEYLLETKPEFLLPGKRISLADFTTYDFTKALLLAKAINPDYAEPKNRAKLAGLVQESNYDFIRNRMAGIKPYPGAKEFLHRFANGEEVFVITSCQQMFHDITLEQLRKGGFTEDDIRGVLSIGNNFSGDPIMPVVTDLNGSEISQTPLIKAHVLAINKVNNRPLTREALRRAGLNDDDIRAFLNDSRPVTRLVEATEASMPQVTIGRPTKGQIGIGLRVHKLIDDSEKNLRQAGEVLGEGFIGVHVRQPWSPPTMYPNTIDVPPPTVTDGYADMIAVLEEKEILVSSSAELQREINATQGRR